MIFNGTVLNQLQRLKNLSSQDNQPFEYDMKVAKTRLEYATNRRDIPRCLYIQSACHFTFRMAGMGKVGDEYFLNQDFLEKFANNQNGRQLKTDCKHLIKYEQRTTKDDAEDERDEEDESDEEVIEDNKDINGYSDNDY